MIAYELFFSKALPFKFPLQISAAAVLLLGRLARLPRRVRPLLPGDVRLRGRQDKPGGKGTKVRRLVFVNSIILCFCLTTLRDEAILWFLSQL